MSQRLRRVPARACLVAALAVAGLACITVPEFRALEREVEDLRAQSGGGGGPITPGAPGRGAERLAELGAHVEALEQEVSRLRGAVQEARHEAEQARRLAEEAKEAAGRRPPPGAEPPPADVAGLTQELRDYEAGIAVYREGRYADAIDQFRGFLQNYPSSEYADNALFWIGECHFKLGEYERAVLTFEDVVRNHSDGNKVPDALYRQGVALIELGRKSGQEREYIPAAREIFERIVKEYPDSERVPEAKTQLEKLPL